MAASGTPAWILQHEADVDRVQDRLGEATVGLDDDGRLVELCALASYLGPVVLDAVDALHQGEPECGDRDRDQHRPGERAAARTEDERRSGC